MIDLLAGGYQKGRGTPANKGSTRDPAVSQLGTFRRGKSEVLMGIVTSSEQRNYGDASSNGDGILEQRNRYVGKILVESLPQMVSRVGPGDRAHPSEDCAFADRLTGRKTHSRSAQGS